MASTRPLSLYYSPDTCMFCHQFLRITTDADTESDSESDLGAATVTITVDDVELYCGSPGLRPSGHHTHWTCLIDHAKQALRPVPMSVAGGASASTTLKLMTCVVCGQNTLDSFGRFIVDVRNEGGETKGFDFGAILVRNVVFPSHPSPNPLECP